MTRLLVVDDLLEDLEVAMEVARSVGIDEVKTIDSAIAAQLLLVSALAGNIPAPEVIVLDLDLGYESGHEVLRFWHGHLRSAGVAMIIWTAMGDEQLEICSLFGVQAVVSKRWGTAALQAALEDCCGPDVR